MCDEDIFHFEQEPSASTSYDYEESSLIPLDKESMRTSAPPPSPEGLRKSYSSERNIAMEQLAIKLSCLNEPNHTTVPVIMRPRAETIAAIPTSQNREQFFQQNFVPLNSSTFFGLYKARTEDDDDDDDDDMECEDSYPDMSPYTPLSLNIRPDFNGSFNQSGSCDPSPVTGEHEHIPFMMGGLQPECYKMNSLKRRTNDKMSNGPYPLPGQECNDISKRSRSVRSSPPFVLYSHLSQSAPR